MVKEYSMENMVVVANLYYAIGCCCCIVITNFSDKMMHHGGQPFAWMNQSCVNICMEPKHP
jgi:hypothetical protein